MILIYGLSNDTNRYQSITMYTLVNCSCRANCPWLVCVCSKGGVFRGARERPKRSPKACISLKFYKIFRKTLIICSPMQETPGQWPSLHFSEPAPQKA